MILGKYKCKKKLEKHAYGDVALAEDPNGREVAIQSLEIKFEKGNAAIHAKQKIVPRPCEELACDRTLWSGRR